MDPYDRYVHRSEATTNRAQRVEPTHGQRHQLPSFRDIIPAHLHDAIDVQGGQSSSRSLASSPVHSHNGTRHVMSETYDEFPSRNEAGFLSQPSRRAAENGTAWVPSDHYADLQLSIPSQQQAYSQQISPVSRHHSGLPSIRDIHSRTERTHNGFGAAYGVQGYQYPSVYQQADLENGQYSVRRNQQPDSAQRSRQAYSNMNRQYNPGVAEYSRYADCHYDPYQGQTGYPTPYSDLDYNGSPMQHNGFGAMGDSGAGAGKRRRGNLPKHVTDLLKQWLHEHLDHPYPSDEDKQHFMQRTGLSISQISNWFINARRRQVPTIKSNRERGPHGGPLDPRGTDHMGYHDRSPSPIQDDSRLAGRRH